ncbi:hypothetical protein VTJ04DRAFT_7620 [Mycothermus thermophilus]|uniref:uncharacterized protein n=1 Tax=Humicola insolens TaxID=85995 RepID=UPI0037445194
MSATTLAHKGMEAVQKKDWAAAIPLLDKALEESTSPAWLLARCHAHQQLKNYDAALHDAELAYHVAAERGSGTSRKQMIEAQYRRAVIYFRLGQYANADCCAKWSMLLAEGRPANEKDGVEANVDENGNYTVTYEQGVADKLGQPGLSNQQRATMDNIMGLASQGQGGGNPKTGFETDWNRAYSWRSQALSALRNLPPDHPGRKVTVTKIPPRPKETTITKAEPKPEASEEKVEKQQEKDVPAPGSVPDEKLKLRVDFYQTNQTVTVSLFAKDAKKEDVKVVFSPKTVQISPIPRAPAPYVKPGDREATSTLILGGEIVPSKSRFTVTPRKIELVLQKAVAGVKWASWGEEKIGAVSLDESAPTTTASATEPTKTAAPTAQSEAPASSTTTTTSTTAKPSTTSTAPSYPTSSKHGPKNWDKVVSDEPDDDLDKGDVNYFFKQLYRNATPEQQRAMMKSFIESNGTALSTDWEDVKNRKVETVPPEGVEAKKWEA